MKIKYIPSSDKRAKDFNNLVKQKFPRILKTSKPEIILLAGGDGAMMRAIKKYNHLNIPFLGIAKGTFNFLMNEIENEPEFLQDLIEKNVSISFQQTQTVEVLHNNENLGYAVNDIILGTTVIGYHTFEINTQDQTLSNLEVKGTGLCISTDLGSTAYSYNLGNPAIPLNNQLLIISGIVCNKYINDIVKIQKINIKLKSQREECKIYIDGIKQKRSLKEGEELILKKGKSVKIGFLSLKNFKEKRRGISNRHRNFN
jgi:NAD+ kinase